MSITVKTGFSIYCGAPGRCKKQGNVKGECPPGRHGRNCVEFCRMNCKGCNRFTGVCEFGCNPGWKGTFCENECDSRTYGEDCGLSCGTCLNLEQCHHINGTCFKGCDRGFQGDKCTKECDNDRYGPECNMTCGNCSNAEQCNHVNGSCPKGCDFGVKGDKCDQGQLK
ncbi:protein draper-like [Saccostrea cucullata]|uniref:protein draper-like n=1 Tax=Saccostrea cuccullata TaxID=36930 RepID=UPI002ED19237